MLSLLPAKVILNEHIMKQHLTNSSNILQFCRRIGVTPAEFEKSKKWHHQAAHSEIISRAKPYIASKVSDDSLATTQGETC